MQVIPSDSLGYGFISEPFLPAGEDEYYIRNSQVGKSPDAWRKLTTDEIGVLTDGGNTSDNWENVLVADGFDPHKVRNCQFVGLVRLGRLDNLCLQHDGFVIPVGLSDSTIISCDIGDNVAVHNVRYLAHYIIADEVILTNVAEMFTTSTATFGNGIVKEGQDDDDRLTIDVINEAGGRSILPFDGILPADAYFWAKFRGQEGLSERFKAMTDRMFDARRGFYGTVGRGSVIRNCRRIKDVKIGQAACIIDANELSNLTINSSPDEPTTIAEGVELVDGVIGFGCEVLYGCKALKFVVMGDNTTLEYGARMIHSFLGDNSTVACCEFLNNLVFPAHQQHHNNSFLIATLIMGQSNVAANATIGSNHNSRAPDGEIHAGRGFWPGLCTSLKHNSRFASFVLLAKGDYPAELDVPLPFSLVSNDAANDRLLIMPAYWWMYNMYALARNSWKFQARDGRKVKRQNIEFDAYAPDTAEEIFNAMSLLEQWTAEACLRAQGSLAEEKSPEELQKIGKELLTGPAEKVNSLEIFARNIEHSRRKVVIIKAAAGYEAYRQILHYYAVKNLLDYLQDNPDATLKTMCNDLGTERQRRWINLGGQLVRGDDFDQLVADIKSGKIEDWNQLHQRYDQLWEKYRRDKQAHALATLLSLLGVETLTNQVWQGALDEAVKIQQYICDQTYNSRKKDYDSPFRKMVYSTVEEMEAVIGTIEDNSFVKQVRKETATFIDLIERAKKIAQE